MIFIREENSIQSPRQSARYKHYRLQNLNSIKTVKNNLGRYASLFFFLLYYVNYLIIYNTVVTG